MKVLIFGRGQDCAYLKILLEHEATVIEAGNDRKMASGVFCDIADRRDVNDLIANAKPDYVFHFAAHSTTDHAAVHMNHDAISTGTVNVLEAVRLFAPRARVFITGSGLQFLNFGLPLSESAPFAPCPTSVYTLARVHAALAARYYRFEHGVRTFIGYFFNHDSPLRRPSYLCQKVATAAARNQPVELDNLTAVREFVHAADVVRAAWLLVNQDTVTEAVIGSGIAHTVADWVRCCKADVMSRDRTPPLPLVSDPQTIRRLGWMPTYDIEQLAAEMVRAARR